MSDNGKAKCTACNTDRHDLCKGCPCLDPYHRH
jgi:hypothetical protein